MLDVERYISFTIGYNRWLGLLIGSDYSTFHGSSQDINILRLEAQTAGSGRWCRASWTNSVGSGSHHRSGRRPGGWRATAISSTGTTGSWASRGTSRATATARNTACAANYTAGRPGRGAGRGSYGVKINLR